MRLSRMGAAFPTRLSFMRSLVRRMTRENWRFEKVRFDVDEHGFGTSVLAVHTPDRTYSILVFTHDLPPEMRDQPNIETPVSWTDALGVEADRLIATHPNEVFDRLTREFERTLIRRALAATGGRRIDAAQLLGIGRNTLARKLGR